MTISTANTNIVLDAHAPKKDAIVNVGAVVGDTATSVTIWARASVDPALTQSIVGTFHVLLRTALNNLNTLPATGPTLLSVTLGGTEGTGVLVDGTPTADMCTLEIGADLITKQQSHFIDRTFKRLIEAWLETNQ